jgi:hypothetical protein
MHVIANHLTLPLLPRFALPVLELPALGGKAAESRLLPGMHQICGMRRNGRIMSARGARPQAESPFASKWVRLSMR